SGIENFRRDQNHQLIREDGLTEMPAFNDVIEIALRKFLGIKPKESYPRSPDEWPGITGTTNKSGPIEE
ncbi:MAG: hypothetical protein PHV83_03980, partial [Bacteroidales bacterium]|nr:hypothetical protein [Bacteroidales bacterium]